MWLLIDKGTHIVQAVTYDEPLTGSYNPDQVEAKEWDGAIPQLPGPDYNGDLDPTLTDAEYPTRIAKWKQMQIDAEGLLASLDAEIEWLNATIPDIDTMELAALRALLKRLAQQNRGQLRAWRYVLRHMTSGEECSEC